MTEIKLRSDIIVKFIHGDAKDDNVIQAAQVSAKGENNPDTVPERLIAALMNQRHGSPFEHTSFTFFVNAPIFVFREWMRHRIGSFNEMSGRYTKLIPDFYTPGADRNLRNIGTKMKPIFVPGSLEQQVLVLGGDARIAQTAWDEYEAREAAGIALEVARTVLPVEIYSQMYWTVNARSLMNFLSLRIGRETDGVRSYPQREIEMGAEQVEAIFAELMPITHAAFTANGRVAP